MMLYSLLIFASMLFVNNLAWLNSANDVSLTGSLSISPNQQRVGDTATAILILQNHTDNLLSVLKIDILGETFASDYQFRAPTEIAPQSSIVVDFQTKSTKRGMQELVVYVEYDAISTAGNSQHRIDTFAKKVEISAPLESTWPEYLVPLILGFAIGQLTTMLSDYRQRRKEQSEKLVQTNGTILALLQGARASIRLKEKVYYGLWEDAIVKGNLFSSVQKIGNLTGKIDLSNQLSELAIQLADYNARHDKHQLNPNLTGELENKVTELIRIFENYRLN